MSKHCWSDKILVNILLHTDQIVHCKVSYLSDSLYVTVCYGPNTVQERSSMWTSIVSLASSIKEPWLLMGDFNAICWGYEKSGGSGIDMGSAFDFNQCVDSFTLIEFPLDGPHFTWSNSSIDQRHIECKLDRALINMKFNQHAHRFEGSTRNSTLSYHKAIPVQSQDAVFLRPPFRFFNY